MTKVCLICNNTFPDSTTFCPKDGAPLRAAVQGDTLIGEVFCDRYVVTDLLGEGGMGAVYAASDVRLPQQVAIKVLREQGMADPSVVARFRAEAEAASRINHDRVARVNDFGFMPDGRAYLVMEFVGGKTLKQVVTDHGPLDVAETSTIVTMVAEGLDAAHRLGIVHRDLKPDNVMVLDDAGGGIRVKVLDFGIAKNLLANDDDGGKTKTGFVIGTPQWMSPEQILGETLDARSDVYSLALLAYMMLTGQRAFAGASTEAEMMARLTSHPRPLHEILPSASWPVGLQELLNRTLARNVDDRPRGTLVFAKEFARIALGVGNTGSTMPGVRAADAQPTSYATTSGTRDRNAAPAPVSSAYVPTDADIAQRAASTGANPFGATQPNASGTNARLGNAAFGNPAGGNAAGANAAFGGAAFGSAPVTNGMFANGTLPNGTFSAGEQQPGSLNKVVALTLGVAAIVAIAFFAIRQWPGNDNKVATTNAPTVPGVTAPTTDGANGAATTVPKAESTPAFALLPDPQAAKPKADANQSTVPTPPSNSVVKPPVAAAGGAGTSSRDADKGAPPRTSIPDAPPATRAIPESNSAASIELRHLMDLADVDFADKDLYEINARIRRFESLLPELVKPTDKGNAYLYIAMSHNAMNDNVKACASLKLAEPLATQSTALRSNVEQWQSLLTCKR